MRTRNVVRPDRKSRYSVVIGVKDSIDNMVVGENSASGFGKLIEATLGIRPQDNTSIDDYFNAFEKLSPNLPGWLRERYAQLKKSYDTITDDGEVIPIHGEYTLADRREYHIHCPRQGYSYRL